MGDRHKQWTNRITGMKRWPLGRRQGGVFGGDAQHGGTRVDKRGKSEEKEERCM